MGAEPGNRDGRKRALALALAKGRSVKDAAREAGVGLRTAHTYRAEEGFDRLVRDCRTDLYAQAVSVLAGCAARAAETLEGLLSSEDERVRLRSALGVLEGVAKRRELLDTEARLAALESALAQRGRR
jgi:hypothetical protein